MKTLASGLRSASVDFRILHKKYHPMLALVKEMIGVIPNADPVLEIWPTANRAYNILVPNMFNLPNTVFGKKSLVTAMGFAMYASSNAALCPYCTAHCCSFALRRGARREAFSGNRTPQEKAVIKLAEGLAGIPATLTIEDLNIVREHFSIAELETLVHAISMMGFLNKFMNTMGIELEQNIINETASILSPTGWDPKQHVDGSYRITEQISIKPDNLFTYLRVIRQAPGAIYLDKKWTKNVPSDYPSASAYLKQRTGHSFPMLRHITHKRVVRAITTVLRDHLNKDSSITGLKVKLLVGYVYSSFVSNELLKNEVKSLSGQLMPGLNEETFQKLDEITWTEIPTDRTGCDNVINLIQEQLDADKEEATALLLAIAASSSPTQVNEAVSEAVLAHLQPPAIVELVSWLAVMQLLQRLGSYYNLINGNK